MDKKTNIIESVMTLLREKNSKKDDKFFEDIFDRVSDMGEARLKNYFKILEKL